MVLWKVLEKFTSCFKSTKNKSAVSRTLSEYKKLRFKLKGAINTQDYLNKCYNDSLKENIKRLK